MIIAFFLRTAEKALNHFLQLDPETNNRLRPLAGKIIEIESTQFNYHCFFIFAENYIFITDKCDREPDLVLRGAMLDLLRLTKANRSSDLFNNQIKIEGDMEVAELFKQSFAELDIDWEEQLSKITGDVIAHQVGEFIRSLCHWAKDTSHTVKLDMTEFLQEETRLFPPRAELQDFFTEIDHLRADLDRLEKRIDRLQHYHKGG